MSLKIPQYKVASWSDIDKSDLDLAKSVDIHQNFLSALSNEIRSKFLYEPMNNKTIDRIKDSVAYAIQNCY